MRMILMVGTDKAVAPFAVGARVHVDEMSAYRLAATGELAYFDARHAVTDAGYGVQLAAQKMAATQAWADRQGIEYRPGSAVLPPDASVPQETLARIRPRLRYQW